MTTYSALNGLAEPPFNAVGLAKVPELVKTCIVLLL
jgi:hypothetical protein